jgi:hypothetical protein
MIIVQVHRYLLDYIAYSSSFDDSRSIVNRKKHHVVKENIYRKSSLIDISTSLSFSFDDIYINIYMIIGKKKNNPIIDHILYCLIYLPFFRPLRSSDSHNIHVLFT